MRRQKKGQLGMHRCTNLAEGVLNNLKKLQDWYSEASLTLDVTLLLQHLPKKVLLVDTNKSTPYFRQKFHRILDFTDNKEKSSLTNEANIM